jgi:hypothetical protein
MSRPRGSAPLAPQVALRKLSQIKLASINGSDLRRATEKSNNMGANNRDAG